MLRKQHEDYTDGIFATDVNVLRHTDGTFATDVNVLRRTGAYASLRNARKTRMIDEHCNG